jgi:hypothetical protein
MGDSETTSEREKLVVKSGVGRANNFRCKKRVGGCLAVLGNDLDLA